MKTFLFACVHNAGRSQMASALFEPATCFASLSKRRYSRLDIRKHFEKIQQADEL